MLSKHVFMLSNYQRLTTFHLSTGYTQQSTTAQATLLLCRFNMQMCTFVPVFTHWWISLILKRSGNKTVISLISTNAELVMGHFFKTQPNPKFLDPTQPNPQKSSPDPTQPIIDTWYGILGYTETLYDNCYTSQTSSQFAARMKVRGVPHSAPTLVVQLTPR